MSLGDRAPAAVSGATRGTEHSAQGPQPPRARRLTDSPQLCLMVARSSRPRRRCNMASGAPVEAPTRPDEALGELRDEGIVSLEPPVREAIARVAPEPAA